MIDSYSKLSADVLALENKVGGGGEEKKMEAVGEGDEEEDD